MKYIPYSLIILIVLLTPIYYDFSRESSDYIGEFYEWKTISPNAKPEHIQIDRFNKNIVWFTLPGIQAIGSFNFKTKKMNEYKIRRSKKNRPDEMIIDKKGNVWFGEQNARTLGMLNTKTKKFSHYKVPYKKACLNGPIIDHDGYIWITDHKNNKIVRFDPKTKKFYIITAPIPSSWVVSLQVDSKNRIWYSGYSSNRIGVISQSRKKTIEYTLPFLDSGPAWSAIDSNDNLWLTEWDSNKIAQFDSQKEIFTEYAFPIKNLGPSAIVIRKKDDVIFFSTFYTNSIVMFNPKNDSKFHSFPIPTAKTGQDDGIAIDDDGVIWFTERETSKIGRFKLVSANQEQQQVKNDPNRFLVKEKIYNVIKTCHETKSQTFDLK